MGDEDKQHIGMDLLKLPDLNSQLIRFNGGIEVLLLKLNLRDIPHMRSFINQLRPPLFLEIL